MTRGSVGQTHLLGGPGARRACVFGYLNPLVRAAHPYRMPHARAHAGLRRWTRAAATPARCPAKHAGEGAHRHGTGQAITLYTMQRPGGSGGSPSGLHASRTCMPRALHGSFRQPLCRTEPLELCSDPSAQSVIERSCSGQTHAWPVDLPACSFAATLGELTGGRVGLVGGSVGVLKVRRAWSPSRHHEWCSA